MIHYTLKLDTRRNDMMQCDKIKLALNNIIYIRLMFKIIADLTVASA